MKKLYLVIVMLIGLSGIAMAQHNCPFNVEFTTQDATCFNNGKVTFTVYDDDHHEVDLATLVATTDIMQVRGYWKRNDGGDTNHYVPDNVNEMTVEPGNYIVGVQAVCSDSIILDEHREVTVGSTYKVPAISPVYNPSTNTPEGNSYGRRYTLPCADLGRIQLKIEGGVMPYTVVMVNAGTGDTVATKVFSAPMYAGNDSTAYNFRKYYTFDSLAKGTYQFYMSDACGYGLPRTSVSVNEAAWPTIGSMQHIGGSGFGSVNETNPVFPNDSVFQARLNLSNIIGYLSGLYRDSMIYRISYYEPSAGTPFHTSPWRKFPSVSNSVEVRDTLSANGVTRLYKNLKSGKVSIDLQTKCGENTITKTFSWTADRPSTSATRWLTRKYDSFDSVYRDNYPCGNEFYVHTREYTIQYDASYINAINDHSPIVWYYINTATNDTIKRDTISNCNVNTISRLTAGDIENHFGVFDSLHQYRMNVRRDLVNGNGVLIYSRTDSMNFLQTTGFEMVQWELLQASNQSGDGCNNKGSFSLHQRYKSTTNQKQNVIRLVESPYNNFFNFTATYDSVSGRWQVEPEDLQDITGMEVFKGTGPDSLYIRGNLAYGPYKFEIQTQCGTYTAQKTLNFANQREYTLENEFKYDISYDCGDMVVTALQGDLVMREYNGDEDGNRILKKTTHYKDFEIINGPKGGYETGVFTADGSTRKKRIYMPGTYVLRMVGNNVNFCGTTYTKTATIVYSPIMMEFDFARAILCNAGDTVGRVDVKGKNGKEPYTYTLYSGPDLTGQQLGSNTTGIFNDIPFTMDSVLSCQVRDDCGAYFSVNITPSQRENIKGAWFEGLKLKDNKCEGDTVTLHAFKEGHFDYQWDGPNGFHSTASDTSFILKRGDNGGWYKVSIAMGCPVPITDSIQLTVLRSPTLAIAKDTTICPGMEMALRLTPSSDSTNALINYKVAVNENGNLQVYSLSTQCDSTAELRISPMYPTKVYSTLIDDGTCAYKIADDTVRVTTSTNVITACDIVTEGDRVCYNTEAEVKAQSTLAVPYVLKWYGDYELTDLLQTDSMETTDWSVYNTDKLKSNKTLYVAVEKEGMCPYVNGIPFGTVLLSNTDTTSLTCDRTLRFFDDGGVAGNYVIHAGQRITHTFKCDPGYLVTLKFDDLDLASSASLRIYTGGEVNSDSLLSNLRQGSDISKAFTSKGNMLTVDFITGGAVAKRGWDARVGVAAVADIDVILRAPRLALATTNDTVCYDNTAHLTASSDLNYPQYYEWWDSKLSGILLRDTIQTAGEVSHFRPEHQIKDSYYYINVYDADYCPLDLTYFNVHRNVQPRVLMNSTATSPIRTTVLQPYDSVPFYDIGGPNIYSSNPANGNVTTNNTTYYEIFKAAEGQVVLHIDTIAIGNTSGNPFIVYDGANTSAERLATVYNNSSNLTYTSSTGALCIQWKSKSATRGWEGYVTTNRTFAELSTAEVSIRKPLGLQHLTSTHDTVCYDNTAHLTAFAATSDLNLPIFVNWYDSTLTTILQRDTIENYSDVVHFDPEHQRYDQLYYISYYNDNSCPIPAVGVEGNKRLHAPLIFDASQNGKTTFVAQDTVVPFYDEGGPSAVYKTKKIDWVHHFKAENDDRILVTFNSFCSWGDDYLQFYDGPDTLSPVINVHYDYFMNDRLIDCGYFNGSVISSGSDLTVRWKTGSSTYVQSGWNAQVMTAHNDYTYSRVSIEKPLNQDKISVINDTVCYDYTAHLSAFMEGANPKEYTWWDKSQQIILHSETTTDSSHFYPTHQISDSIYYVTVETGSNCPYHPDLYKHERVLRPELLFDEHHQSMMIYVEATDSIPFYDMGGKDRNTYSPSYVLSYDGEYMWIDFKSREENRRVVLHIDSLYILDGEEFMVSIINSDDSYGGGVFDSWGPITLKDTDFVVSNCLRISYYPEYSSDSTLHGFGWAGYIYTELDEMDLAEANVKIRAPYDYKYITPTNDSVCYDYTASLSASSPLAYPQYYSWWDIYDQTLLHQDTVYDASDKPEFHPEHQISDTMYYAHVYNDETCPYLPAVHKLGCYKVLSDNFIFEGSKNNKTTVVDDVDSIPFYDCGGPVGPYVNYSDYVHTFTTDSGHVVLKLTSFFTERGYDYLYVYDGPSASGTYIARLHGDSNAVYASKPRVFTSTGNSLTVRWHTDLSVVYDGWKGYVYNTNQYCFDLAETEVTIRRPYGSKNMVTTHDTVCYDNTAHLTALAATSDLELPIFVNWYDSTLTNILHRDTLVNPGDVSHFDPTNQRYDRIYYISSYNDKNCPVPTLGVVGNKIIGDTVIFNASQNGNTTMLAQDMIVPFYDEGGPSANYSTKEANWVHHFKAENDDKILVTFNSFQTYNVFDYLQFYDGPDTLSPVIPVVWSWSINDKMYSNLNEYVNNLEDLRVITSGSDLTVRWVSNADYLLGSGWDAQVMTTHNDYTYSHVHIEKPLNQETISVTNDTVCYDYTAHLSAFVGGDQPKNYIWWDKSQQVILQSDTLTTGSSQFYPAHQISDSIFYVTVQTSSSCPYHPNLYRHERVLKPELPLDEEHQGMLIMVDATDSIPVFDMGGKDGNTAATSRMLSWMWIDFRPREEDRKVIFHIDSLNLALGESFSVWRTFPDGSYDECYPADFSGPVTVKDTNIEIHGIMEFYYSPNNNSSSPHGYGWAGYIYTEQDEMDFAEAKVKIRAPLEAKYITPTNDTVCYDNMALLSASSPLAYPQYYSWWDIDAQTLLHRDTVYSASEKPEFHPEHQITDTMYYVHVYNDTTCPYLPDLHRTRQFFEVQNETLLNQEFDFPDTVWVFCGDRIPFYDDGGKDGKTIAYSKILKKVFIAADPGHQVVIHIDTLSVRNHSDYGLKFIENIIKCSTTKTTTLQGSGWHNYTYQSTVGMVNAQINSQAGYMGWEGYVTLDCDTSTVLAETKVSIREPLDGKSNAITTNDTVCYDNTATLTATSTTLTYPQYYNWWNKSMDSLLLRDTVLAAGDVSTWMPTHQTQDSLYYITVYDQNTCPLLPGVHAIDSLYQMAESHVKVIPVPATVTTTDVTFCPNVTDTLLTAVFTDVTPTYTAVWMSEGDTLAVHKDIPDTQLTDTLHYTAPSGTLCGDTRKYHVICVASTGCETVGDTSLITYAVTEDFTLPSGKDSVVACLAKALVPAASQLPTVTDGCGNVLTPTGPVSADSIPSSCEGKRTYTYTYTDCASRSHEWTYTYWIRMPEQMAGVPANDTLEVDYVSEATAPGAPDIADECGRTISPAYDPATDSVSTIATDGTGTIEHTYTYTDCAGHDSTYTRVYRLSTISTPLRIASGDCTLEYNGLEQTCEVYTVTFGGVTVDECMACRTRGGYTHRYILPATGDTVTIKDAIVVRDVVTDTANTYTAVIGHASRYTDVKLDTGRITVTPLAIGITAADSTKECDGTALTCDRWSLTSGTLGDGDAITSVTVTGSQDGVGTSPNKASDAKIEKGTEDVTHNYTITYNDGQLTVTDTTKPTFTSPKDTTLYKDALCNADTTASSIGSPTNLADNCADASALTVTHTDGNYSSTCAGSYTFERVWRVTDATGNYRETKQTVTVSDTVRPVYERPKDTTVYKDGLCAADTTPAMTGQPTGVKDNCTDTLSLTIVHYDRNITETCAGSYTFERVWRVVDECGNVSAVADSVQTVTVSDTTRPEFEVPADTVICREVATDMVVNPDKAVTGEPSNLSDNCTDAATLQTNTSYTDVDPSTVDHDVVNYIERHWTVTDACGNVTEKVQRIGVFPAIHDGNTPMQCHDTMLTLAYGRCDTAIDLRQPTWSTSVTGAGTIRLSNDAPARFPEGATVVTWTLTDTCGFTVTCQQTVTVSYPPCGRPQDTVLYDGFTYHTVRVGCECWLQENLRNRVYSDGTDVAVYSSYEHSDQNEEDYGLLYTWYSAVRVPEGDNTAVPADSVAPMGEHYVEGACPAGWAVPTDAQYEDLWLNGYGASGLKDKDARYWLPGYAGTDPNSYFNARGAGYYDPVTDRYYNLLGETYFWTGEPTTNYTEGHCAVITSECPELLSKEQPKGRGQSIRCVQKR